MINKKFKLEEVKKFLKKKGFVVLRKNNSKILNKDIRSFYLTALSSLVIILFFFSLPVFVNFQKNTLLSSIEIENRSKSNLEKVLKGQPLNNDKEVDEGLNLKNLFEDVFKFDELPTDTVRLNASTI